LRFANLPASTQHQHLELRAAPRLSPSKYECGLAPPWQAHVAHDARHFRNAISERQIRRKLETSLPSIRRVLMGSIQDLRFLARQILRTDGTYGTDRRQKWRLHLRPSRHDFPRWLRARHSRRPPLLRSQDPRR